MTTMLGDVSAPRSEVRKQEAGSRKTITDLGQLTVALPERVAEAVLLGAAIQGRGKLASW